MQGTRTRLWVGIVIVLGVIIVVLALLLFLLPAPQHVTQGDGTATSTASASSTVPLHTRVVVTTPQPNTTVTRSFTIAGQAPGPWFFEASFPIELRDQGGGVIGRALGTAQGDWMTAGQVTFVATMTLSSNYSGPATLVLKRDNPSGLPQNDDELQIPVIVQ